jgi:sterol 14alpha-demethylase
MRRLAARHENFVPRLAGGLPVLGHAIEFRRDPVGLIERGRNLHGDVFSLSLFGKCVHVFTGPPGNEAFFKARDDVLSAREAYQFTVPIFGRDVAYDASPELMDQQLRMARVALRDDKMQSYAQFIAHEVATYVSSWGESGTCDLLTAMNEITIRTAGRCLIGPEFSTALASTFARLYHDLERGINIVAFFAPNFPLPAMLKRDRARRQVAALMSDVIAARRVGKKRTDDFLDTLIMARGMDGAMLSDEVITGLLLTLLFAGQHTSAVLATWTGVLLLQNPEHLSRVLAEQTAVFENQAITVTSLRQLAQLERCIKETERLHPPLVMLMRKVLRDFEFGGYLIPAGDLVLVSPAVSHKIAEIFVNPDRYDPDRFGTPREEDRRTPYGLIGFGGGKHRCIGLAFAYQQVKVIWSVLLQHYTLDLIDHNHRSNFSTFVVGPRQPCRVRYRRLLA